MFSWWYWSLAVAAFIGYSVYVSCTNSRARRRRLSRFEARKRLATEEWYRVHFADSGITPETAVVLFEPIARAVGCDMTQLRADDAFDTSLAFRGVTFLGIDDDDPLGDFAEWELPRIVGSDARADAIVRKVEHKPTLHALACAVSSTAPEPSFSP